MMESNDNTKLKALQTAIQRENCNTQTEEANTYSNVIKMFPLEDK
jgi:hypothetical protein